MPLFLWWQRIVPTPQWRYHRPMSQSGLTNHFLLAMPAMAAAPFAHSVTYLCEHNENGAMGIIINRQAEMVLDDLFQQMDIEVADPVIASQAVFAGGPVLQNRGFVLHNPGRDWESSLSISNDIAVTTSRDILVALAAGKGPANVLVALGYAGWGAGQLETELMNNDWLAIPADPAIVFDSPVEKRWQSAAGLLGVDPLMLSGDTGHA